MKTTITTEWDCPGLPEESVTTVTNVERLPDLLMSIERHLLGAGFKFDGELEIVESPSDVADEVETLGEEAEAPTETVARRFLAYCRPKGSKTWTPLLATRSAWPTACGDCVSGAEQSARDHLESYVSDCVDGGHAVISLDDWEIAIAEASIVKVIPAANG